MERTRHETHKAHGWRHYFYEFFMLFLAVFCGFLAENIRESRVEQNRAEELARNLYKELNEDSIDVQSKITYRYTKEKECEYFVAYVKDSNLTNLSPGFFHSFTASFIQIQQLLFEPGDGVLNQLRNSGDLRYFKSGELQAAVGKLSVMIANTRSRNEKEYSYIEVYLRPFIIKHYDFNWYESLTENGRISLKDALNQNKQARINGKIVSSETFNRKEAENLASYYLLLLRSTRQNQYAEYLKANRRLLGILRKEYPVE